MGRQWFLRMCFVMVVYSNAGSYMDVGSSQCGGGVEILQCILWPILDAAAALSAVDAQVGPGLKVIFTKGGTKATCVFVQNITTSFLSRYMVIIEATQQDMCGRCSFSCQGMNKRCCALLVKSKLILKVLIYHLAFSSFRCAKKN